MSKRKPIEWTPKHAVESFRYALRWADEAAGTCDMLEDGPLDFHAHNFSSEGAFRTWCNIYDIDPTPAVRRVDDIATGRFVREMGERWHVRARDEHGVHTSSEMPEREARRQAASVTNPSVKANVVCVRVTRIRRNVP